MTDIEGCVTKIEWKHHKTGESYFEITIETQTIDPTNIAECEEIRLGDIRIIQ